MSRERSARLASLIRDRCLRDPVLGTTAIDVTINGDVLELRANVSNAAAKARIEAIAREVAPDLRIDSGIVVAVTRMNSDETLERRANTWIARHHPEGAAGMGVSVVQGKAILRGEWPNLQAVKEARAALGRLQGITAVDASSVTLPYRVDIPEVGLVPIDQRDTVNKIEEQMAKEGYRLGNWVDAHMYSGTVELVGVVDTPEDAAKVAEIAARTPGVRRVFNRVRTRQGGTNEGRQAEQRIIAAWGKPNDPVSPADLHVFVVGDRAYVSGQVDTLEAKRKAVAMAQGDPAIKHVTEHITIVTRREHPVRGRNQEVRRRTG